MNKADKTQTTLGEIKLGGPQIANFQCTVANETQLSLILQDEMGRSQLQERYSLNKGLNELSFSTSSLKKGTYTAWIDVQGETFIRTLVIQTVIDSGIIGKFKQWLNFF